MRCEDDDSRDVTGGEAGVHDRGALLSFQCEQYNKQSPSALGTLTSIERRESFMSMEQGE